MKILAVVAMAIVGTRVWGAEGSASRQVSVCMTDGVGKPDVYLARATASKMFGEIGITIEWRLEGCSRRAEASDIRITLSCDTPANQLRGALAYSLPYEGTHIVVYYDRVKDMVEGARVPYLLAHVLVHEITHVLTGTDHHSDSGVMKAQWGPGDYVIMSQNHHLAFSEFEVTLIYQGLDERESRASATHATSSRFAAR